MTWVKIDDGFYQHPKRWEIELEGVGLWLVCLCYAGHMRTDGFVPEKFVRSNVPRGDRRGIVKSLRDVGLLVQVEDGYVIPNFLKYNPSREETEGARSDLSQKRSEAGKRGAAARWANGNSDGNQMANGVATAKQTDGPVPEPVPNNTESSNEDFVERDEVCELFDYWRSRTNHPTAKLTKDRKTKVKARLAEGYTSEQIRQAIDGAARAAFVNDRGKVFNDLELICRSGSKLEDFIDRATTVPAASKPPRFENSGDLSRFDRLEEAS